MCTIIRMIIHFIIKRIRDIITLSNKELIDRRNTVLSGEKEGLAALSVSSPDKISCRL